jgi:hypothetical protein
MPFAFGEKCKNLQLEQLKIFEFSNVFKAGLWIRIDSIRIQQFSSIRIRIRIHKVIESGSNPDQDPQQYFRRQIFFKDLKVKDISSLYYFYTFPI